MANTKISAFTAATVMTGAQFSIIQGGTNKRASIGLLFLTGSATINFASVDDNASSAASNVTVTGAVVGDFVVDVTADGDIATTDGVFLLGKVTAADVVEVTLHNDSGGAFNANSQTVYVIVIPKASFGL